MKSRLLIALALLLAAGGAYYFTRPAGPNRSLAVVPARWTFIDRAGLAPTDEPLAEALTGQLSSRAKVQVIGWPSILRYRGAPKSAPDIARDLDAAMVMAVSVRLTGGQSRVTVVLAEPFTGRMRWTEDFYAQDLSGPGAIGRLAASIAQDLETTLGYHH